MTERTDAAGIGRWVAEWIGGVRDATRNDTGATEQRIETSVERLGHAVVAAIAQWGTPAPVGVEPIGVVGYTVHGTQYVNWRSKAPAHGTKIYTAPQPTQPQAGAVPLTDGQIDAAAKKLAECMEYPWEFMPEPGRKNMRKHAQDVIDATYGIKGGQHGVE